VVANSALVIDTTDAGNASGADVTFEGTLDSDVIQARNLSLTAGSGNIGFNGVVGGVTTLGDLIINSAHDVTADLALNVASLRQVAGSGTTTFAGAIATTAAAGIEVDGMNFEFNDSVSLALGDLDVDASGTARFNGQVTTSDVDNGRVTISNGDQLTITWSGDMDLQGAFLQDGAGVVSAAGDITTINDNVTFQSATTLTGGIVINTGSGLGAVTFNDMLDSDSTARALEISAGTGDIGFGGAVGNTASLGAVMINSVATLDTDGVFKAASFTQNAGSVLTRFDGAVMLTNNFDFTGQALSFNGSGHTVGGSMTVTNAGLFTTADAADFSVTGQFTQDGSGTSSLGGNLTATAGIDFSNAILLSGTDAVTLVTGGAVGQDILLGTDNTSDITGAGQDLILNAGAAGDITIAGDVGAGGAALGAITITNADQVLFDETVSATSFTQNRANATSGLTQFDGALSLSGAFDFTGHGLTFSDAVDVGGSFDVTNSGLFTKAVAGEISVAGDFTQDGVGGVRLANQSVRADGDLSISGATTLANNFMFSADELTLGAIDSDTDGAYSLLLDARESAELAGPVGQVGRLSSLSTGTSGALTVATTLVSTTGSQDYNVPLTFTAGSLISPLVLRSQSGDIDLGSTVSAGANSKGAMRSVSIQAPSGNVYVRNQVGTSIAGVRFGDYQSATDVNPYGFAVSASDIWLFADVTTFEQQLYDGRVHIGNNGSNGFTRLLVSLDPSVEFTSTVNDTTSGEHTLDVRAVTTNPGNGLVPTIRFGGSIGQTNPLYSLFALAGIQASGSGAMAGNVAFDPPGVRFGTVTISGDVATVGNQTYLGGSVVIGANSGQPVSLYSESGSVSLLARPDPTGGLVNGSNLRILLGDLGNLNIETFELIRLSGLDPAIIVQYLNINSAADATSINLFAGADLQWVQTGMENEDQGGQDAGVMTPNDLLLVAEVDVGLIQATECDSSSDGQDDLEVNPNPGAGDNALACTPVSGAGSGQ